MKRVTKVNVLGTEYTVTSGEKEELNISPNNDGECKIFEKEIELVQSLNAMDCVLSEEASDLKTRELIVHEVCHAFFNEGGVILDESTEEQVCTFLMKNFRKMANVVLEICEKFDVLDS